MELSVIRYFLAIVETMNFTQAAANCDIRQPTLTRAIGKLEDELGGELFNRERNHTHLTELGRLMLPRLRQCHDSAVLAKELAREKNRDHRQALKLAISHTVPMHLLSGCLAELKRQFHNLVIEYVRFTTAEIVEALVSGKAELAIAGRLHINRQSGGSAAITGRLCHPSGHGVHRASDAVQNKVAESSGLACRTASLRFPAAGVPPGLPHLDCWSLFEEDFALAVSNSNFCAGLDSVEIARLRDMTILDRPYCECHADLTDLFMRADIAIEKAVPVSRDDDLIPLVRADLGVCVIPRSLGTGYGFRMIALQDCGLSRTVSLYSVASRKRTAAGVALAGLLTSHDWVGEHISGGGRMDDRLLGEFRDQRRAAV